MSDPEAAKKHEKYLENMGKQFEPLPVDRRHLPQQEQEIFKLKDEVKSLQQKNAELLNELEERDRMLEIAAIGECRYRLNTHKFKMMFDWVLGHEYIYCSVDQNTKELVNLSIDK
jgi:predicted RNase H-like nuclease (RuvC/YqgF family)